MLGLMLWFAESTVPAPTVPAVPATRRGSSAATRIALALVRLYRRRISPLTAPRCRFVPTCSGYGEEAFARHGFRRGAALTLRRLQRCRAPVVRGTPDPCP
jgi:hypothetical protein